MSSLPLAFQEQLASLQSALLEKHPRMPGLLQEIHRALKLQPENVTLMSEDEIAIVVQGLQVQTQTSLIKTTIAKKSPAKKTISVMDL